MLFSFHNEFDDTDVTLDSTDHTPDGPYTVQLVFGDRAIGPEYYPPETFATLREAHARFLELVKSEVLAVLDDGTLK